MVKAQFVFPGVGNWSIPYKDRLCAKLLLVQPRVEQSGKYCVFIVMHIERKVCVFQRRGKSGLACWYVHCPLATLKQKNFGMAVLLLWNRCWQAKFLAGCCLCETWSDFFNLAWSWCVHNCLLAKVESFPHGVAGPKAEIMVACKFVYEMFFMNYGSGLFSHAGFAPYQYHWFIDWSESCVYLEKLQ